MAAADEAALLSAIKRDDIDLIRTTFPQINLSTYIFSTSLGYSNQLLRDHPPLISVAAFYGAESIILEILNQNPDLTQKDNNQRSIAYFAVAGGRTSTVKILMNQKADFSGCCHLAAGMGNLEILKFLINDASLDPTCVDALGNTLLHSAAMGGSVDTMQFLTDLAVIDINSRDNDGNTPLHLATESGNVQIVKLLVNHPDVDLNPKNIKSQSILHIASKKQNETLINSILAAAGIGTEQKPKWDFMTLDFLALNNDVEVIGTPSESKPLDLNPIDDRGVTPFLEAVSCGNSKNIDALLSLEGVNVNARDKHGHGPVHMAVLKERADILETLLSEERVDVNLKDREGLTALHIAVRDKKRVMTRILLENESIDVNCKDPENMTPLHMAAQNGDTDAASMLMKVDGIDVNCLTVCFAFIMTTFLRCILFLDPEIRNFWNCCWKIRE